jgi:hypothetical protein
LNIALLALVVGSNHGSSRIPASYDMWRRFRSIEYGFLSEASTGILCLRQ